MKSLIEFYEEWLPENGVKAASPYLSQINKLDNSDGLNYLELLSSILFYAHKDYSLMAYYPIVLGIMNKERQNSYIKKFVEFAYALQKEKLDNLQHLEVEVLQHQLNELRVPKNEIKIDAMDSLIQEISEDVFIKKAIESSFFFCRELVKERHKNIVSDLENNIFVPVRRGKANQTHILYQEDIKKYKINTRRTKLPVGVFNRWNVFFDAFGNDEVIKLITRETGYVVARGQRNSNFPNYIISHVWGNAGDPRYFTNLWNIVLVPAWANFLMDKNTTGTDSNDVFIGSTASKLKNTMMALCNQLYGLEKLDWSKLDMECPKSPNNDILSGDYQLKVIHQSQGDSLGKISVERFRWSKVPRLRYE